MSASINRFPWSGTPAFAECNFAFGHLVQNLPRRLTVDGRVHAETYISAVGAIAGYAAQRTLFAETPPLMGVCYRTPKLARPSALSTRCRPRHVRTILRHRPTVAATDHSAFSRYTSATTRRSSSILVDISPEILAGKALILQLKPPSAPDGQLPKVATTRQYSLVLLSAKHRRHSWATRWAHCAPEDITPPNFAFHWCKFVCRFDARSGQRPASC